MIKKILVTGCAGFIGSNYVRYALDTHSDVQIIGLDKLTYAGTMDSMTEVMKNNRFEFIHGDICDQELVEHIMSKVDSVVNFAAESMVDRSVLDPEPFLDTNFKGVNTLLSKAKEADIKRFLQISTQEVFGHNAENPLVEEVQLNPRNLYAACKAGAEMLAQVYFLSYGLPVVFTRGANALGAYQYPEKVAPVFITNAIDGKPLPLYGDGTARRDYIHVDDLNAANDLVLRKGKPGEAYNVITGEEKSLLEFAEHILKLLAKPRSLIQLIDDRPGHDYRYYLNASKIRSLGWCPKYDFEETIKLTVEWYKNNERWWRKIKNSEQFQNYEKQNYAIKF